MGFPARRTAALFTVLAAGLLASARPAPAALPPPASTPKWAPSIEAGLAEAKSKGIPLLVALNMDNERGNEHMLGKVYTDPAFLAAAGKCVCTIASLGSHDSVKDASGRAVCARFGSLTCAEHKAVEKVIREQWLKRGPKDDVISPQHFFLAPDGRRLFQRTWQVEAKELAALLDRARELCAPEALSVRDTAEDRLKRVSDPLAPVREEAIAALAGLNDPAVDGKLGDLAKAAADEGVAVSVLDGFALAMNPARVAAAAGLLGAKSPEVRMHAAVALEASKDPAALKALTGALGREKDAGVKGVLYRSIAGCAPEDPAARSSVLGGLKERAPGVLPQAIVALAPWAKDPQVIAPLKALAFSKEDWRVRAAACWTLGLSGQKDLAPKLREIKEEGKESRLVPVATLAAQRLNDEADLDAYRRAVKQFAWSPIRHPGEPEE
ncbi:MAG TPA: HEAT repeat domain-containing protein [Planctomycetota bacterium]|nr:HEAT repeat domain-containing protein [Planctomycetota bacterium]